MNLVGARALLQVWEEGLGRSLPLRSLAMIACAFPLDPAEIAALPLSQSDALLLRLRRQLFGVELEIVAACPSCACTLESSIDSTQLCTHALSPPVQHVQVEAHSLTVRAPTLGDLFDLPHEPAAARRALVARCCGDADEVVASLPADAIDMLEAAIATADPDADFEIALTCPQCAQRVRLGFDIASFLWREIDAWARRTLRDVHALARAYSWREADVLEMSATRRQMYLQLVGA